MEALETFSCGEWVDTARAFCEICDGTEPSFEIGPPRYGYMKEVKEVYLDRLRPKDYLVVYTENSVYRFTVLDPERRYGILTGGQLGYHRVKSTLIATIPGVSAEEVGKVMVLKERTRAVFHLPSVDKSERLVTSLITKLTEVTGGLSTVSMCAI